MVAFSTIFLLVKILQQPIRIFEISGYWSCHGEENACYHVKEHIKPGQKLVSKVTLYFVWGHLSKKQTVIWASPYVALLNRCMYVYPLFLVKISFEISKFSLENLPLTQNFGKYVFASRCRKISHLTSFD